MIRIFVVSCLALFVSVAHSKDDEQLIQKVTEATVLIKARLLHGFAEDRVASGRWTGSGFLVDREKGWVINMVMWLIWSMIITLM